MSGTHKGNIQPSLDLEEHEGALNAKRVSLVSGPTIYAVVNTSSSGNVTVMQGTSPWVSSLVSLPTLNSMVNIRDAAGNNRGANVDANNAILVNNAYKLDSTNDSVSAVVTSVVPGTGATSLGKAEDAAHTSGDVGVMALGVRNENFSVLTTTEGDYSPMAADQFGRAMTLAYSRGDAQHDASDAGEPMKIGGYAKAAAPADVSGDGDRVNAWFLRNGAQAAVLTAGGALIGGDATNGLDVDVTRVPSGITVVNGAGSAFIGLVTIANQPPLVASSAYIGLASVNIGGGNVGITGNVTLNPSPNFIGLVTVANQPPLVASSAFIGLVTAVTRNAGTNKTLRILPITMSTSSVATIAVPTNTFYITHLLLNSNATVRLNIKSGVTYLTGNASLGINIFPGGGWVENGAPDSPIYMGQAGAAAIVIEKADAGGTISQVGGKIVYFEE